MTHDESLERSRLVSLAQAMLDEELSFFEGAVQVLAIKNQLKDVATEIPISTPLSPSNRRRIICHLKSSAHYGLRRLLAN